MKTSIKTGLAALLLLAISCTKVPLSNPQVTGTQTQDNAAAQTSAHFIGERFGGGIIFYLKEGGNHGLIADTIDLPQAVWYNNEIYTVTGALKKGIGSGKENSRKILESQGQPGTRYAAALCAKSKRGGYTDWFLPSKAELNELYLQKNVVLGFADNYYWSSSEEDQFTAWSENFTNGYQYNDYKSYESYVRAIRAF